MDLKEMQKRLQETKNFYLSQKGEYDSLKKEFDTKTTQIQDFTKKIDTLTLEKKLIDEACTEAREQGRQFLEELATLAVSSVFQDDTKVKLILDEKGDTPILDVKVIQKDEFGVEQEINPSFDGGGLNDVISLCFFVAIAATVKDNYAPYVLDEPSKYVSKGNLANNFSEYMKEVSTFTDKQIIMSTHDEAMLNIGSTIYSIQKNGKTKVSEIKKDL